MLGISNIKCFVKNTAAASILGYANRPLWQVNGISKFVRTISSSRSVFFSTVSKNGFKNQEVTIPKGSISEATSSSSSSAEMVTVTAASGLSEASPRDFSSPEDYLRYLGHNDPLVIAGIIEPFQPASPASIVSALHSMKTGGGMQALVDAVLREIAMKQRQSTLSDVCVYIKPASGTGDSFKLVGKEGQTFYDLHQNNKQLSALMECACGGIAACSTCHIYVDPSQVSWLPPVDETEQDMLDLAAGVSSTSRLGCQIRLKPNMSGLKVTIPNVVNNLF